ncbi:MAG: bifunctional adenosylcobinamide kinase/adenosylcobinamide-phosphate guanylyltransferase [Eubacteriaceae bacterium]|nr:bifunctional adenosylcobinamide kinase/adenosylcobinamide-phosphate guanylyltransferase [Eubacteriaceae bacterium]
MVTLILGGSRSGKSMLAQVLAIRLSAIREGKLFYFATMVPVDEEDEKRVARHRLERDGWGFEAVEEGYDIASKAPGFAKGDIVLFDSVTSYVMNILFSDNDVVNRIRSDDIPKEIKALSDAAGDLIIVSDYIFSDAERYSPEIERYRSILGKAHLSIASFSDAVIECTYANVKIHKNTLGTDFAPVLEEFNRLAEESSFRMDA